MTDSPVIDSRVNNARVIKFMAWRRPALLMSGVLTAFCIGAIAFKGLRAAATISPWRDIAGRTQWSKMRLRGA